MFFSRYEYQPIYLIIYNFLRCREKMAEGEILSIIDEDGYDGLKAKLDVEEITKLAIQAIETYLMKTATIDFQRLVNDYLDDNLDYFMDLNYFKYGNSLQVFYGILKHEVELVEEKNKLEWVTLNDELLNNEKFAGNYNIPHIIKQIQVYFEENKKF